ncbi:MAG: hypothetical protein ACYC27_04715 [Armatimonadota bacterium]
MDQIFIDELHDDFAGVIYGNLPAVSISPLTGRTHGAWVDTDTGRITIGISNEAGNTWETIYEAPNIPIEHTGSDVIRHLSMAVDSSDRNALTYEYHDSGTVELWIYDERLVDGVLAHVITYAYPGSSPAMMLDKDLDILCFYRTADGRICWRSRANPEGATWGTEYTVDISSLGLSGDLYPMQAFLSGGMAEWESCRIVLVLANSDAATGRYSLKYIESAGYPLSIIPGETAAFDAAITGIEWAVTYDTLYEDSIAIYPMITSILWAPAYNPITDAGPLIINTAITEIKWTTTTNSVFGETAAINAEIRSIIWTPANTYQEILAASVDSKIISIVWS